MLYHAFEIATDGAYELHVEKDEKKLHEVLAETKAELEEDEDIEYVHVGTVYGESVEDALNNIRSGEWKYKKIN